jgi:hypothetical protein
MTAARKTSLQFFLFAKDKKESFERVWQNIFRR